ncbi:MAG: zf-TFIIB domain-containing protein [Sulfurovum sp.]|nr:zf-TFIIB domain-containing protein [Sulfurovum sp.]
MNCIYCGAPMPKRGLVCNFCSQRNPLNLSILEKVKFSKNRGGVLLDCPSCEIEMERINVGIASDIIIHRCVDCDGVFIGEECLETTIKHQTGVVYKVDYSILRFILDNPRQEHGTDREYRSCPVCAKRMNKAIYAAVSGVLIDRCLDHGIWLDSGELQQLFEWKSTYATLKTEEIASGDIKILKGSTKRKYTKDINKNPVDNFLTWVFGGGMV